MVQWVPQTEFSSTTQATLRRTRYLAPVREITIEAIQAYISANPNGEGATLAVLNAVGRERLTRIAGDGQFGRIKQDLGLLSAQLLVEIFGADRVETLRRDDRVRVASRRNTWKNLEWVNSFAPHRILPT